MLLKLHSFSDVLVPNRIVQNRIQIKENLKCFFEVKTSKEQIDRYQLKQVITDRGRLRHQNLKKNSKTLSNFLKMCFCVVTPLNYL